MHFRYGEYELIWIVHEIGIKCIAWKMYAAVNTKHSTAFQHLGLWSERNRHHEHWLESCFPAKRWSVSFAAHEFHNQKNIAHVYMQNAHCFFFTVDILKLCHWNSTQRVVKCQRVHKAQAVEVWKKYKNRRFWICVKIHFYQPNLKAKWRKICETIQKRDKNHRKCLQRFRWKWK